jgi:hypothetical protein
MIFYQWYAGRCVLSYYEKAACVGTVLLHSDIFDNPMAFFRGPDEHSVVCFSCLDTSHTAFTVDFTRRNGQESIHSLPLKVTSAPVVDRSNFEVRACTTQEVDFVRHYIETADLATLSGLWGARPLPTPEVRQNLLNFLESATTTNHAKDDAHPQVLPED